MLSMQKLFDSLTNEGQGVKSSSTRRKGNAYNVLGNKGQAALHIAAQNGNLDEVAHLLDTTDEALYYVRDEDGNTALHLAAANGRTECLNVILNRVLRDLSLKKRTLEHSINAVNNIQETALHLAVQNNHYGCAELLIKHTDTTIKNANGQTALCVAVLLENIEIVRIFVKNRHVDCDVKDENGYSVYDHIRRSKNRDLIKLLLHHYVNKGKEVRQEIEKSEYTADFSKRTSKIFNGGTGVIGAGSILAEAYVDRQANPIESQAKRSLVKLAHATEKIADGIEKYIKDGTGKKKIAHGHKLAKEAAISANKVKEMVAFNKSLITFKTVATFFSLTTCILLAPVCVCYCASRYYNKKQKLLSNTEGICEKRQRVLEERSEELKKQGDIEDEVLQLKGAVADLQEELQSVSLRGEKELIASSTKLERVGSFRRRTGSYGEQDAKRGISEQQRRPSLRLQHLSVEQSTCSKYLDVARV